MVLDEEAIKHALIRYLQAKGELQDATLINEFVVANWSRRVDLAVANGKLAAFEIKSERDSLRRLQGQISTYLKYFDKVTVVTVAKFALAARELTPSEVEVLVVDVEQGVARLRVARRGRTNEIKNLRIYASLLRKDELRKILLAEGAALTGAASRIQLTTSFSRLPLSRAKAATLGALKTRYEPANRSFAEKLKQTDEVRLDLLSRFAKPQTAESSPAEPDSVHGDRRKLNLSRIEERWGKLPVDAPQSVVLRLPSRGLRQDPLHP